MDLLFDVTCWMTYLSNVSLQGQPHELAPFAHWRHRQQRVNVRSLLKSQADANGDLGTDFRRLIHWCRHG